MAKQTVHVISWGGGTQSTALMLKMLDGEIKDADGNVIVPDYIIFADTGNESKMTYAQVYKVQKYIEETYGREIIITRRTKELLPDEEIIRMVKSGEMTGTSYRSSKHADLYQNQLLFYKGVLNRADIVPHWVINKDGNIGKLMGRQCTATYKIGQIMTELRERIGMIRFNHKRIRFKMYIGFTVDEIMRVKPNPLDYVDNLFPLVDLGMSKIDCIDYVKDKLGFRPVSSVCDICYANNFDKVYEIYKNDKEAWDKLLALDDAMEHKGSNHRIRGDVYMFRWQANMRKRLADIDMEKIYADRTKYTQLSIFDLEEEGACMGGCFI
jgi:hypothetical protein